MNEAIKPVPQPRTKVKITQNDILRFWSKVNKTESIEDCWVWKNGKCKDGYGKFWIDGDTRAASRVSWMIENGDIPDPVDGYPLFVCHKCDNPSCVNPHHLFLGTFRDNIDDMLAKGRSLKGEASNGAVLSEPEIEEIRRVYMDGNTSSRQLAKQFNVSKSTVLRIVNGKTWTHRDKDSIDDLRRTAEARRDRYAVKDDDVLAIYNLYFTGTISARKIGGMFGVAKRTILSIINGNYASRVPLPPHIPSFDALRAIAVNRRRGGALEHSQS